MSLKALIDFIVWFLRVAIDQVEFMSSLFDLDNLSKRLHVFVTQRDDLKPEAARLLDEALMRGEIERGEASRITGLPERSARRVLNDLIQQGMLASITPKGPVSLRFPVNSLETLFPLLYPRT
jgi:Fic family protein